MTVLYFLPHQGDELLSMGIDICNSISRGYVVHVILCTNGSKCKVRQELTDGKKCDKHLGKHFFNLTRKDLIISKDKEFRESCRALGVKDSNVHVPEACFVDTELTICNSKKIILQYLDALGPDCIVCAPDPNNENSGQHCDHKSLGYAAVELFNEGVISELRLFTEPYHSEFFQHAMDVVQAEAMPMIETASVPVQAKLKKAVAAYSQWEPEMGRYAMGYHSDFHDSDDFLKSSISYSYVCKKGSSVSRDLSSCKCKKLIVSLTSYPARINSAVLSLDTVFKQCVTPDAVILWLASSDFPNREGDLPSELVKMVSDRGLSICWCEDDLKPHNKYFWTFKEYPDALVITVDDDILYHSQITENLYRSYLLHPQAVSAARICFVPISEAGKLPPYELWPTGVDIYISRPSMQFCATGVGGVLYPTVLFSSVKELFDPTTIKRICLYEDDLWLKAMELVAGIPVVVAEEFKGLHYTPGSQGIGLWHENIDGGKSQKQLLQIQKEIDNRYGKNTFINMLMGTTIGDNLVGNSVLCGIVQYYKFKSYRQMAQRKKDYAKYITLRVDIRNRGNEGCNVTEQSVSPDQDLLCRPGWLKNGITIESEAKHMAIALQCQGDGELEVALMGRDVRNGSGIRYPVWIDCTYFAVNGETIFSDTKTVCHDKRYIYRKAAKNGEMIMLEMAWSECQSSNILDEYKQLQSDLKNANSKVRATEAALKNAKAEIDKSNQEKQNIAKKLEKEKQRKIKLERDLKNVKNGWSFKVGRVMTFIPRKIKNWLMV